MITCYAFTIELPQALPDAVQALRAALAVEQMGIVSEVDVQPWLQAGPGPALHAQRLLGICSPKMAHALLSAEPELGALLPCGCGVAEATSGCTRIALQDPRTIAAVTDNADVRAACELAHAALRRVVDRLTSPA